MGKLFYVFENYGSRVGEITQWPGVYVIMFCRLNLDPMYFLIHQELPSTIPSIKLEVVPHKANCDPLQSNSIYKELCR